MGLNEVGRLSARHFLFSLSLFALAGCSTFLITHGVLDDEQQRAMRLAETRDELEAIVGQGVGSKQTAEGLRVELYRYVDGEAGVIGTDDRPMSGERLGRAAATGITVGLFEVFMVPIALNERAEAARPVYVIYSDDEQILAICPRSADYPGEQDHLCHSIGPPQADAAGVYLESSYE